MRYKDLITVLFVVATATWIWAEPSQQVKAPTKQQSMATKDWTLPALDLSGSTKPILESADSDNPPADVGPRNGPLSFTDYDPDEFRLDVRVSPGSTIKTTYFDITFHGPKGFDLIRDGGSGTQFSVAFDPGQGESLVANGVQQVGENRWRFRGSDLSTYDNDPVPWDTISHASLVQVTTVMRDQRQSRYSRGANIMLLESDPVEVTLR